MITKDTFLRLAGKTVEITLPDDLGVIKLKELGSGDYRRFVDAGTTDDQYARLLVASICDDAGTLLYGPADIPAVSALPMRIIRIIWNAALDLNGLSVDSEEAEKNSSGDQPSSSDVG